MRQSLLTWMGLGLFSGAALAEPPQSTPASRPAPAAEWTLSRGDARLNGVSRARLPERLSVRWRREFKESVETTAAIWDNTVYVGCDDGNFAALHLATGEDRWRRSISPSDKAEDAVPIRSSPSVIDGAVLFGDDAGVLHCLDARSGAPRWEFKTGGEIISSVNHSDGRLVFGSYDGALYCLDAAKGGLIWKYEAADRMHATPAIVGDMVLAAGCDGYMHVVRIADGQLARKVELHAPCGSAAATLGDRTVVGTYGGNVLGLDCAAGKVVWTYANPDRDFPFMSSAALCDGLAVIGGRDKRVYGLDLKTGAERWQVTMRGRVDSSALILGRRVFVASGDGVLLELNLADGAERWRFEAGGGFAASPAAVDGALVISTTDGVVYCFGDATDADASRKEQP